MNSTKAKEILNSIINDSIVLTREVGLEFFNFLSLQGKRVEGLEDNKVVHCGIVAFGNKGKHIIARATTIGGDEFYGFQPRKTFTVSYESI